MFKNINKIQISWIHLCIASIVLLIVMGGLYISKSKISSFSTFQNNDQQALDEKEGGHRSNGFIQRATNSEYIEFPNMQDGDLVPDRPPNHNGIVPLPDDALLRKTDTDTENYNLPSLQISSDLEKEKGCPTPNDMSQSEIEVPKTSTEHEGMGLTKLIEAVAKTVDSNAQSVVEHLHDEESDNDMIDGDIDNNNEGIVNSSMEPSAREFSMSEKKLHKDSQANTAISSPENFSAGTATQSGSNEIKVSANQHDSSNSIAKEGNRPKGRIQGEKRTNLWGMVFIYIEPNSFLMGNSLEKRSDQSAENLHKVVLTNGYWLQISEVTQGQWIAVMGNNPSVFKNCGLECPVENISWYDAQSFIKKLRKIERNIPYRLPTEAEWEYVATRSEKSNGQQLTQFDKESANFIGAEFAGGREASRRRMQPLAVCSFSPNAWGFCDMIGNVKEWCQDWYVRYPDMQVTNPIGPPKGIFRITRGGAWYDDTKNCTSTYRNFDRPEYHDYGTGLRLAIDDLK